MRKSAAPGGTHDDAIPNSSPSSYHCRRLDGVRFPFKGTPLTPVFLFCYCTYYTLYTLLLLCTAVLSRGIRYTGTHVRTPNCTNCSVLEPPQYPYRTRAVYLPNINIFKGVHEPRYSRGVHQPRYSRGVHKQSL